MCTINHMLLHTKVDKRMHGNIIMFYCSFVNIRWLPIFVDFVVEFIREINMIYIKTQGNF